MLSFLAEEGLDLSPNHTPIFKANVTAEIGQPGRYQIFFSPHAPAAVYLLDTGTGKIRQTVTIKNTKDTSFK